MEEKNKKNKRALLTLRAVIIFAVLAAVIAVIYWAGYDAYPDVARWSEPGYRDALIMDGKTYRLDGVTSTKKYPLKDLLGEVEDDGVDEITEAPTEAPTEDPADQPDDPIVDTVPEETEPETETYDTLPDEVVSVWKGDHAYLVYSVEKEEDRILVLFPDGKYYLYILAEEESATEQEAAG